MVMNLKEMLRFLQGGEAKPKPAFKNDKEAYDFCRHLYKESGGVTPELRRAYEFYQKHLNDDCGRFFGPSSDTNFTVSGEGKFGEVSLRRS